MNPSTYIHGDLWIAGRFNIGGCMPILIDEILEKDQQELSDLSNDEVLNRTNALRNSETGNRISQGICTVGPV